MAVQANRQLQLKDSSGNELTSNAMTSTIRSVSVNNVMQALIPVGTSDGSSVLTKRIPVPVQVLQAGHSGDPKVKTMPSQYVRLIKTPNKVNQCIYEVWLKRNGTDVTDCETQLIIGNKHFHSVA